MAHVVRRMTDMESATELTFVSVDPRGSLVGVSSRCLGYFQCLVTYFVCTVFLAQVSLARHRVLLCLGIGL